MVKDFNEAGYLAANPDVLEAVNNGDFKSGWHHYKLHGKSEGRDPNGRDSFDEIDLLSERIVQLENELREARAEYKQLRTSNLREAVEARREADKAIAEELNSLGYNTSVFASPIWMRKFY